MKLIRLAALSFCTLFFAKTLPTHGQSCGVDVQGDIDTPLVHGAASISGWAEQLGTPNTSINVDIYIDGTWLARTQTVYTRTDVNNWYYTECGNHITGNHGFAYTIPAAYNDNNTHTLTAYAIATDGSANAELIGSPFSFTDHPPEGNLEQVNSSNAIVSGWAFDPDQGSYSVTVQFYMDNPAGFGGRYIGSQVTTNYRADVNSTYGITGNHGFEWLIPAQYTNS